MSIPSVSAGWTDARVDTLAVLWRDGLSASQIARQLGGGVTRNAVIGKLHRLGLAGRAKPTAPRRLRVSPAPTPRPRRLAPPRLIARTPSLPLGGSRSGWTRGAPTPDGPGLASDLTALALHACRWPIGDPRAAGFSFCGRAASAGGAYCADHARRAHQPGSAEPLHEDAYLLRLIAGAAA